MTQKRRALIGVGLVATVVVLACASEAIDDLDARDVGADGMTPLFEVDPLWPRPLPNHWILGSAVGVGVDSRDHVYIVHRGASTLDERTEMGSAVDPPTSECCAPAPFVLEFDPAGNLMNAWGGESTDEYTWPASNHGITIDPNDNIWIGGNGEGDGQILKFSRDGEFLAQYGTPGVDLDSNSTEHFGRPAKISFNSAGDEAFVADGYRNRRVAVLDPNTGEVKRYWGAYGNEPLDEDIGLYDPDAPLPDQFRTPVHCAEPTDDGRLYVCDRANDRIQVFQSDGTFIEEVRIAPETLGSGSTWDIAFSRDPEQTYMYVADGKNMKVHVMDRASLEVLTAFGDGGRQPGLFFGVHSIATDSQGNIYTTETYEGKRVQKFVFQGIGPIPAEDQGAPWPTSGG